MPATVLVSLKPTGPPRLGCSEPRGVLQMQGPAGAAGGNSSLVRVGRFYYKFQCVCAFSLHRQGISETSLVSYNPDTIYSGTASDSTRSGLSLTRQPLPHFTCNRKSRLSAVLLGNSTIAQRFQQPLLGSIITAYRMKGLGT